MSNLVVLLLLLNLEIVYNNDGDGWGGDKVVWTKFHLIPKPVLSNFTKSFHSVFKNSLATVTPKPVISTKLNQTKLDVHGLRNVSHERKVPMDAITLSSKVVEFPQDRTEPPKNLLPTSAPEVVPRRRRRPVIRYEEEESEEDDDDDDEDITDELVDVEDDDDDEDDEEEEVEEVVEEVPESSIGVKNEYEGWC